MPIRPSLRAEIRQLVGALETSIPVQRESAIARLAVLGARATEHLLRAYPLTASSSSRAGMLRALEASGDSRGLPLARTALHDSSPEVAAAALTLLRRLLSDRHPDVARDALDALVTITLDPSVPTELRVASLDALRELPSSIVEPIRQRLGGETASTAESRVPQRVWNEAVTGKLPATPDHLKRAVTTVGPSAPLTDFPRIIDRIRAEETAEQDPATREEWRIARGTLHQVLATRGSRLALYDLRESLRDRGRMPLAFLSALEAIGDTSCLEPVADAYEAAAEGTDSWWRDHVATVFRTIVHRQRLTRRHAVMTRIGARHPAAAAVLIGHRR